MWIVRLALRRPYTFAVLALLLMILGPLAVFNTPTDIFPNINIPVVSIVWQYTGLSAEQMANRIIYQNERSLTTTVNNIEHIESNSMYGIGVVKVYFQPSVEISSAVAQITAICQTQLKQLPPGTTPPLILQYSASSVPILQLGLSGQGLSEQQLNDFGLNFIRTQLVTIPGTGIPYPYGGKQRQVQVDINPQAMQAKGITPADVVTALGSQNIIEPSGTLKVGTFEYQIETNSSPETIQELNDIPIRSVNGAMVYMHDIGHVRDGFPPQTNIVRVDGQRATLLSVIKTGNSSTLDIVKGIRGKLKEIEPQFPPSLKIKLLGDQSIFVRASIDGVVREALIAACLTAVMILLFLGSWRSTLIIAVSIPLSILSSLLVLSALGETINIMTLGGLALAVGILVDDATVEIENINRNLEEGKAIEQAILDGAAQIAVPALVATISICIVFVPMFFLSGVARYLFVPLAEAVCFAMLASYLLSRTVVPTMAKYLLKEHDEHEVEQKARSRNPLVRFQLGFEHYFEKLRRGYYRILELCLTHSTVFLLFFLAFAIISSAALYPFLGEDFFPSVDSGQFEFHVRAQTGTRIEDMADLCDQVDRTIREVVPEDELITIIDNIGLPYSGINTSYSNDATIGPADADISVSLTENHHPTDAYVQKLRTILNQRFPGTTFYTLPVDMTTQILNFGLPAPIDIQIVGKDLAGNRQVAEQLINQIKQVPGTADLRIQQPFNLPVLTVDVNRTKAMQLGLQQSNIASSLLAATAGSFQTSPNFWMDPKTGVSYQIAVQAPQYLLDSMQDLENIPIVGASTNSASPAPQPNGVIQSSTTAPIAANPGQLLSNVANITPGMEQATVTHYNIAPVLDIYGNVVNTDLKSVDNGIEKILATEKGKLPRGSAIVVRGQVQTMKSSFIGLISGLVFSILLVYLLIVVNFQSWLDPFIIISGLPAAIAGIVWFLFLTHTRISVPALTGAIMCMGVATSNSILVISFAREQLEETVGDAREAALSAGFTRFRPVIMTALAMIIGMVPMALGLGDGGEQNAPLGRAVIGGLLFATISTLFFVPTFFSVLHGRAERKKREREARHHSMKPATENLS
ncbi:efflux RND transporter permease subunit [Silvibacterium dinghuense]|uniref:Efflux RND transporter permease subunit n=1 Tax=Silvibacterium dinghuense TaxID=1560006 RepID=A0A4Q1SIS9_9BACT|nr:efflux RND transporter permease subunit [Silvibacterium dinghuense]RXS97528.1 efflux RND transporter permease subunit [Silvibacterium dinghuense]GGG99749.1 RND transporter [Silvibacterium dinghuense]